MFPLPQLLPRPCPLSFAIYLKQQQKTLQKKESKTNKKTVRQNMPKCKNKKTKQNQENNGVCFVLAHYP